MRIAAIIALGLAACGSITAQPEAPVSSAARTEAGADGEPPVEPTPEGELTNPQAVSDARGSLAERFVAALTSCNNRASCCPELEETRAECEAGMVARREELDAAFAESQSLASGTAHFDPDAVARLEVDVASCTPLIHEPWFMNSMVIGTIPEGESCNQDNLIDLASCVDGLFCVPLGPVGRCGPGAMPVRLPPPTTESSYCRSFDEM